MTVVDPLQEDAPKRTGDIKPGNMPEMQRVQVPTQQSEIATTRVGETTYLSSNPPMPIIPTNDIRVDITILTDRHGGPVVGEDITIPITPRVAQRVDDRVEYIFGRWVAFGGLE